MEILDLDRAKEHLKIRHEDYDDEIQAKLTEAHGIVAEYIGRDDAGVRTAEIEAWDEDTAPSSVKAAVLMQLGWLWRWRGDEADGEKPPNEHGWLAPGIVALLHRQRDPVVR